MHKTINWPQVVKRLQAAGRTQHQIAAAIGVDQSTVCRLGEGRTADPKHSIGQQLLAMLADVELASAADTCRDAAPTTEQQGA